VSAPLLLALALAAPSSNVSPAAELEAKQLAHTSQLEFDLGHFEEALRDVERAYVLDPLPGLLFNLGQCHRQLKHWEQAEAAYRSYLHYRPNAPNRETVLKLIDEVQQARAVSEVPELGAVRPLPGETAAPPRPAAPPVESPAVRPLPGEAMPPPPEAQKRPTAAPAAATQADAHAEAPSPSHALGWTLLAAAAVSTGFAIYGGVKVANWQSQAGQVPANPTYTNYENLAAQQPNVSNWEVAAFVLAGVAVAGVVAGVATW